MKLDIHRVLPTAGDGTIMGASVLAPFVLGAQTAASVEPGALGNIPALVSVAVATSVAGLLAKAAIVATGAFLRGVGRSLKSNKNKSDDALGDGLISAGDALDKKEKD